MSLRGALLAAALLFAIAIPVGAYLPAPERIHAAIAEANVASSRTQALRLELTLQIGERTGVATGELISHPTGLARLELRGGGGLLERHLAQGTETSASRNGKMLDEYRAFLPPYFILQADTSTTLRAALTSFGVDVELVGLAECGEKDCLILGDPTLAIPRPEPPQLPGLEIYEEKDQGSGLTVLEEEAPEADKARPAEPFTGPRLMVDSESYEIRGLDGAEGVHVRFGPPATFDTLRVPAWIQIEEPGRAIARFDVLSATQVAAPASVFSRSWLLGGDSRGPGDAAP